jgi:small subunit ribosomal protein S3
MGQKVHPTGFRLGISTDYSSKWYANSKDFSNYLLDDYRIREYLKKKLKNASVSKIVIERPTKEAIVNIYTSRPGIVIGKKGEDIEVFRNKISTILKVDKSMIKVNVKEIKKPELDSQLVAEGITQQLERRIMYRRAMKRAVTNTMRLGALGIKVNVAGRLNGAEIARSEWYREGRVPLHTLDAAIDYGFAEALTTYGIIGVKVWIYSEDEVKSDTKTNNKNTKNKYCYNLRKQNSGNNKREDFVVSLHQALKLALVNLVLKLQLEGELQQDKLKQLEEL